VLTADEWVLVVCYGWAVLAVQGWPGAVLIGTLAFLWHCPIVKPYFGWRVPRRDEWFR
jgi:hypothetical protein